MQSMGDRDSNEDIGNEGGSCEYADFGLKYIAESLGRSEALQLYWNGAAKEENGLIDDAIRLYKQAFRLWPALDSIPDGGIPRGVREEAIRHGIQLMISPIDVAEARASRAMHTPLLLTTSDLEDVESLKLHIGSLESLIENNPENKSHLCKTCLFLNNPPNFFAQDRLGHVIEKMISFAEKAWEEENWSGSEHLPGPLFAVRGGIRSLSIRVVEYWTYSLGGALTDPMHYDVDSVITIIALLADPAEFDGGIVRTNEPDGQHLEYRMQQRDVVCFLSHKYHNITPITRGVRRSLVIELWQGGIGHRGR